MIDPWDIEVLEKWLKLAKTVGTDAIKIVAGDEDGQYIVTVEPQFYGEMLKRE